MDINQVFNQIGGFGRAQIKIVVPLNFLHIACGLQVILYTFIGEDPGWSCPDTATTATDNCARVSEGSCTPEFSKDFTSIVTEWNLICTKSTFPKLSQSAYFFGLLLGSWVWGKLSDSIGRRKVIFLSLGFMLLSGIGTALSFHYYVFVFFRICSAFSANGMILSSYVLSVELVDASSRSLVGVLGSLLFGLAFPLMAAMAYFVRQWRVLTLCATLVSAVLFGMWRIVPESPRWLLVNGRVEEAKQVLADLARGNGTEMPRGELKAIASGAAGRGDLGTISLFSGRVLRRRTFIVLIIWFAECMVYYGLSMRVSDLGSNRYISTSLSGLIETPGVLVAYKALNRIGRRWTQSLLLLIAGVACLSWALLHETGNTTAGAPVALLGKFAVAGSFAVAYLYTTELFPTEVRNVALGVASAGARVGGILAPVILMTAKLDPSLPMIVMGGTAFFTGVISFCLPETLNQPLPDTISELES